MCGSLFEVPEMIGTLSCLEVIKLDRNDISDLPDALAGITSLTELTLKDNLVEILPLHFALMTRLVKFEAQGNNSRCPPREVMPMGLTKVQTFLALQLACRGELPAEYVPSGGTEVVEARTGTLDYSSWSLVDLDLSLTFVSEQLEELTVSNNLLQSLPETLHQCEALRRLDVSECQFRAVPGVVVALDGLTALSFRNNLLQAVPLSMQRLNSLRELDLSENAIAEVPPELGNLAQLRWFNLSANQLTQLPGTVGLLTNLTHLSVGKNKLPFLPETLKGCKYLTNLDLSWNRLSTLREDLSEIRPLRSLDVSHNRFAEVPQCLWSFLKLQHLDLRDNLLEELPSMMVKLSTLDTLHLGDNKLSEPPPHIVRFGGFKHIMDYLQRLDKCKRTEQLDLGRLALTVVPTSVLSRTTVKELSFRKNNITTLRYQGADELVICDPERLASIDVIGATVQARGLSLSLLTNLVRLDVSCNKIQTLPVDLLILSRLESLNVSDNHLSVLYLEFAFMPKLKEIERSNNEWRAPHGSIIALPTSELFDYMRVVHAAHQSGELKMHGRRMQVTSPAPSPRPAPCRPPPLRAHLARDGARRSTCRSARAHGGGAQVITPDITLAENLRVLDLSRNSIEQLPNEISALHILEELHLRENRLTTLPWELGGLVLLSLLDLGQNKLSELPGVVGTLSQLQGLMLDKNGLAKLPNAIGDLPRLERLAFESNRLAQLPPSLVNLTSLTLLDASNNSLNQLPHRLGNLAGLEELLLQDNELQQLPESIAFCTNLHTLDLRNNFIERLPSKIHYLTNLTHLSVRNNKVRPRHHSSHLPRRLPALPPQPPPPPSSPDLTNALSPRRWLCSRRSSAKIPSWPISTSTRIRSSTRPSWSSSKDSTCGPARSPPLAPQAGPTGCAEPCGHRKHRPSELHTKVCAHEGVGASLLPEHYNPCTPRAGCDGVPPPDVRCVLHWAPRSLGARAEVPPPPYHSPYASPYRTPPHPLLALALAPANPLTPPPPSPPPLSFSCFRLALRSSGALPPLRGLLA
jgi:Leucine-rich repeat (LRR) protein